MTHTEGWSWFDAPELSDVDLSGHTVTAVLVCRNAGAWLNATLAGLGQLDRRPDQIVAVDNESSDDTAELLEAAYAAGLIDKVIPGKATFSFGQAVERALTSVEAPTKWVWFLHDDAIPDHDALTELVNLAARTPRLAVAVPLLVRPSRRNHAARTLEIGATISGSGWRNLGLEPDEVAQGQYESTPVLGGSTCGMLVRWETLIEVGGFDRCISGYRDGIDIGWRAQMIDQWVLTCPTARIVHRQAGRSEMRQGTIAQRAGRSEAAWDRLMGLRLVAAHAKGFARFVILLRLTLVCLIASLGYVLGRAPDHAKDELQAWSDFLFRSRKPVARLRKKISAIHMSSETRYRIRSLRPTLGNVVDNGFQSLARWFHDQFSVRSDAEMTLDDLLGDEFTRRIGEGKKRIPAGVWFVVVLAGVGLMARNLYTTGLVTASGLLGAPATLAEAFQRALSSGGKTEPWMLVSAAASALSVRPTWFPVAVMVLAFPLTMLVGVWFLRHRIHHPVVRWFAAAGYALIPILMGGLNRGSLWLVAFALILPFAAEWVSRIGQPWMGARSLQTLAGISLAGVIVIAIEPALWVPIMIAALVAAVWAGGVARIVRVVVSVLLPVVFWGPALPSFARNLSHFFLTPEPMLTGPESVTWQMLFARPVADGLPPLWVSIALFSVVWIGAIVAMAQPTWHRWCALAGVASIGIGMWLARLTLSVAISTVNPDPSPWLLAGYALLLFSFLRWMDDTVALMEGRDFGGTQALVAFLSLLTVCAFLLGSGWAAYAGMSEVQRGPGGQIPEYLAQNEVQLDTATLIIDPSSRTWNLRNSGQTVWGQGSYPEGAMSSNGAVDMVQQIVARAIAGRPDDSITSELAMFGISAVVVMDPGPDTITALDATSGFQRATSTGQIQIWTVSNGDSSPTRRSLVNPGDPPVYLDANQEIPPGSPRTLVLATPADPDLHVYVGGAEVKSTSSGDWRAAYSLGTASGAIDFVYTVENRWVGWTQLAVFVLFIIFVFPPMTDGSSVGDTPRYQVRSAS